MIDARRTLPVLLLALLASVACVGSSQDSDLPLPKDPDDEEEEREEKIPTDLVAGRFFGVGTFVEDSGATVLAGPAAKPFDGLALSLDPRVHDAPFSVVLGLPQTPPGNRQYGFDPLISCLVSPDGLVFDTSATSGRLVLPVNRGLTDEPAFPARWNMDEGTWDAVSTDAASSVNSVAIQIDRLGWYGVFRAGRSLVRLRNDAPASSAPSGIVLHYHAGPVGPEGSVSTAVFRADPPPAPFTVALDPGEAVDTFLLPGTHKFTVEFPDFTRTADLNFRVPTLTSGADDTFTDQTISLGSAGAVSDDAMTQASLRFRALLDPIDRAPEVTVTADVPAGVELVDAETGFPAGPTTKLLRIGPIAASQIATPLDVVLRATATDAEDGPNDALELVWTWSNGTDPVSQVPLNGATVGRSFLPPTLPVAAGIYTVHVAAYDSRGQVGVGTFLVDVVQDPIERLELRTDRSVVDYGRRDVKRTLGCTPVAGVLQGLCDWVDLDGNSTLDQPLYQTLETGPDLVDPDQDPGSLTCVVALVTPSPALAGLPLEGGFESIGFDHSRGTLYSAFTVTDAGLQPGSRIPNLAALETYNEHVLDLATQGFLVADTTLYPGLPPGTRAIPILYEAPADPDPTNATNDCSEFAACPDPNPGSVAITFRLATANAHEQRAMTRVAWPDDEGPSPCSLSLVPDPMFPDQGETVALRLDTFPKAPKTPVTWAISGTDGFSDQVLVETDLDGRTTYLLPPVTPLVDYTIEAECAGTTLEATYRFTASAF